MLKRFKETLICQKGFAMLEVAIACALLAILGSIAAPKFFSSLTTANTVKVQSDLRTLDTGIVLYITEKGANPNNISELSDYVMDVNNLKPPKGKECKLKDGTTVTITSADYKIENKDGEYRATCDGKTAGEFGN